MVRRQEEREVVVHHFTDREYFGHPGDHISIGRGQGVGEEGHTGFADNRFQASLEIVIAHENSN